MRSLTKYIIGILFIGGLVIGVFITGVNASQPTDIQPRLSADKTPLLPTPIITNTLTLTLTSTPTTTLVATSTSTPTPTPTSTRTATPSSTPTSSPTMTPAVVVIEEPEIHPSFGAMCDTYWYRYTNDRGHYAYLTLNVDNAASSTNWGVWRPAIVQPGYYRVEAYIPYHAPIPWECPVKTVPYDTSDALYTIQHANGKTIVSADQKLVSNSWLDIGEYLFRAGSNASVTLSDLNSEVSFTSTVSFSAAKFTWLRPPPLSLYLPITGKQPGSVITSTVAIINAPALDQCFLPTTSKMQTWWNTSPYRITNVYIGGGMLYNGCTVPDKDWIKTVQSQGWALIPTWVGPQAPCSDWHLKMSSNPVVAYQQGKAEADAASAVARDLGLTTNGMGGTIIYYDVENFSPANLACRETVTAFISGWTERLQYWGNRTGAYGGGCTSYVADWAGEVYSPKNLWVAAYINPPKFRNNVSLFGIACVPDSLWPNHQRIRQYASGHNETWGNVTFNIDSNIADAEVVSSTFGVTSLPTTFSQPGVTPEISDIETLPGLVDQNWIIADGVLYKFASSSQLWQPVPSLPSGLAMRKASFVDSQLGWALGTSNDVNFTLYSTLNAGISWIKIANLTIEAGWTPASMQFLDAQTGWIAIKELTRNIFNVSRLLTTNDGGISWRSITLPIGGSIHFISPSVGWIAGGVGGNELYTTRNGGSTWEPIHVPLPKGTQARIFLPAFYDSQTGILPVIITTGIKEELFLFTSIDEGNTWQSPPGSANIPDALSEVSFTTPQVGWGTANIGACQAAGKEKECQLRTKLWRTLDGGTTWTEVEIP